MDDIVKKAMAKWPDVPDCYGWLALDARGAWRMRDERAQQLGLAGDKVVQTALLGFINRNYLADARGCWYFQNGPQRVYVNLEATPFIARTDPQHGFVVHTGAPLGPVQAAWFSDAGALLLRAGPVVAQLDDRDLAAQLDAFTLDGAPVSDQALLDWIDGAPGVLSMQGLAVGRIGAAVVPAQFGFIQVPHP